MSYPPPPPQGSSDWQQQPAPAYGGGYSTPPYGGGSSLLGGGAPGPYGALPPTSGKATTSLVLGIASMVLCFIGFLLGIPAIIVGLRARKEIRESQGRTTGDGLALGGIITGVIGTLAGIAVVAAVIGLFAVGTSVVEQACDQAARDSNASNDC